MPRYTTYRSIYDNQVVQEHHNDHTIWDRISDFIHTRTGRLLVVFIFCAFAWKGAFSVFAEEVPNYNESKNVIVQPGDSLWSIAASHKPKNMDTRQYVLSISEMNGLQGPDIQAGEVLALPLR